jgi:hypothetical protein
MLSDGTVLAKCFAAGLGRPVRTKDGKVNKNDGVPNPRADGFSLYMNYVGSVLLKNIIPKAKLCKLQEHILGFNDE